MPEGGGTPQRSASRRIPNIDSEEEDSTEREEKREVNEIESERERER